MQDENQLGKGIVLGELCYAGKTQLDLDPLIDRGGEDAVALSVYSTRLHFYISTDSNIVADVEEGRVDCPCLWADLSDVEGHVAQLHVAYRLHGPTVHVGRVPVPAIKVKPEYVDEGHFGSTLASCSGNVSKRVYMVLFRLLHILFPTLNAWSRRSLEAASLGLHVGGSEPDGVLYSLEASRKSEVGGDTSAARAVIVKPNFLLGCLEAARTVLRPQQVIEPEDVESDGDDSNDSYGTNVTGHTEDTDADRQDRRSVDNGAANIKDFCLAFEEQTCLKTVRHLDDVVRLLDGAGTLDEYSTPLSSPQKHRSFSFQSPAKKPLNADKAMDLKLAISMVEMGATSDFRDGALFLQTACQSQKKAEYAIRRGAFRALVVSSSMMLASKVMGSVEQLSILTMTASQLLDKSSPAAAGSRALVKEFVTALQRPAANPALLLHFLTAMIHRPDIKEAAIEQKLYNALAAMYIQKLPLLEPLAEALVATRHGAKDDGAVPPSTASTTMPASTNESNNYMHGFVATPKKLRHPKNGVSVPPLSLSVTEGTEGVSQSPAGLTRATRRESDLANHVVKDTSTSLNNRMKEQSAVDELEHLAQALGESLVAKDLPSLIEHRRRLAQENSALFSTCDSTQEDKWTLHQTASVADLRAHKILSGEDSTEGETDDDSITSISDVVLVASRDKEFGETYVDSEDGYDGFSLDEQSLLEGVEGSVDLCPYLVNAMLAVHSHLPGCYVLDPNPSHMITADILSFPAHIYEGNLYVKSCLQLLTHISASQAEADHVFLVAVGNKLRSLISSKSFGNKISNCSLAYYLDICLEYVSMCSDASMSSFFAETVLQPLTDTLAGICSAKQPIVEWSNVLLALLNTSLKILVKALDLCATNTARREYLLQFFGGERGGLMALLRGISAQTLLCNDYDLSSEAATELGEIEKNILMLYSTLVNIVGNAEPLDLGRQVKIEVGDDVICRFYKGREPKLLTRTYCMQCFSFLIVPGTFLIRFSLEDEIQTSRGDYRLSSRSIRLRNGVFGLLQSLFSAKDSPYIMDKELTDYYVRLHFIRFLKLYHNPNRDHQATFLCRQHLSMLCTLAQAARKSQGSSASRRFQHLSVVGFFIKEMSLEYEALESEVSHPRLRSDSSYDAASLLDRTHSQSATSARSSYGSDSSVTDDDSEAGMGRSGSRSRNSIVPPLSLSLSGGPFGGRSQSSSQDKDVLIPALTGAELSPTIPLSSASERGKSEVPATNDSSRWRDAPDPEHQVLERQGTSMAISIGTPATPGIRGVDVQLPLGFTFTGDLDEDVDRLEALGLDDPVSDVLSDSEEYFSGDSSTGEACQSSRQSQSSRHSLSLALASEDASKSGVPKLSISSSMRSSLHRRNESAELLHAVEEESQMRKAGRSFLGDMERQALGNGKMQAVRFSLNTGKSLGGLSTHSVEEMSKLERERSSRLLYQDDELHVLAIKLVLMLIIDADGQLHSSYCDRFPWERKMQNIPFILQHHLNADSTRYLLPKIVSAVYDSVGSFGTTFLKVLCADNFRPAWYNSRSRISGANGAYATVYRASVPWWSAEKRCVLKVIDLPRHNHDRCSQVEFYSEVAIHQKLANHSRVCKLYDFGVDSSADALVLVLEEFKCSLKQWRLRHGDKQSARAPIYWAIFREIVVACMDVLEAGVVHFDIKSDNILLNPLEGVSEEAFWRGTTSGSRLLSLLKKSSGQSQLAFRVVLADFGESVFFPGGIEGAMSGCTHVARGTDLFKSPEQLLVGGAQIHQNGFDRRRRHHGAGAASDVWSLGCLLFELFTGTTLFSDNDWLQLAARVTTPGSQLITPDKQSLIACVPEVEEMISFMLVRDPSMRPTLADVLQKLDSLSLSASDVQSGSPDHTPRSSRNSPSVEKISSGHRLAETRGCHPQDAPLGPIDCLAHVSDKLCVCSVAEFARLKRPQTEKSRVIMLSSTITADISHWDQDALREFPMRSIFSTPCLQRCLETACTNNASAVIYRSPENISNAKAMESWLKHALSDARIWEGSVCIVSDHADAQAALLALALVASRIGVYQAMVAGSAAGALDKYLTPALMDVLASAVAS